MDISAIDRSATQGRSWLHVVAPSSKLVGLVLLLASVIVSWNALVLAALAAGLLAVGMSAKVPMRLLLALSLYPALFAAIFAFASAPSWLQATVIVLKAVTAALASVLIVLTTPYPQVFAPVQRVVPGVVGDALLMTYRAFFLLAERFTDVVRSIRLRAPVTGSPMRSMRSTGAALGNVLLYSADLAQREYDIMRVRGYEGRLRIERTRATRPQLDAALIALAALGFATALLWRIRWESLNPYSWFPLGIAMLMLGAAGLYRWRQA